MVIHCREFLELYSDYRDGLIADAETKTEILRHLETCVRCMEYDALIARGVIALCATSNVQPSHRLRRGLRRRFATAAPGPPEPEHVQSAPAGIMAGLMVAGSLVLLGWLGTSFLEQAPPPAQAAQQPASSPLVVVANPGIPFVGFAELRVPAFTKRPAPAQPKIPFGTWVNLSR